MVSTELPASWMGCWRKTCAVVLLHLQNEVVEKGHPTSHLTSVGQVRKCLVKVKIQQDRVMSWPQTRKCMVASH